MGINGSFRFRDWTIKRSNQVIFDSSYEQEEVTVLEILSDAGDIRLEESTDGKIQVMVYGDKDEEAKVSLENNRLRVDGQQNKSRNLFFGWNSILQDIVIYLPKEYAGEISIEAAYGDIEILDLEKASLQIEANCGDVNLGKVKTVSVKNDLGNVKIKEVLHKLWVELSCGDVKINSVSITEDSSIVNNLGNVKIGTTNDIYIDAKTDLGDVKVNQNHRHSEVTLKIENNCGDIKVEN